MRPKRRDGRGKGFVDCAAPDLNVQGVPETVRFAEDAQRIDRKVVWTAFVYDADKAIALGTLALGDLLLVAYFLSAPKQHI